MDRQGLLLCAKYAVSPNFFGYCGPPKNSSLIDHLKESFADEEISNILSDFETLYPYLQLIARGNKINDPFDQRVVEAYWIGNKFLNNVKNSDYLPFIDEKLFLEKRLSKNDFIKLKRKIARSRFLPHHNFHVFNIFKQMGQDLSFPRLKTMDECRIGFGKIKNQSASWRTKIKSCLVESKPLIIIDGKLGFGNPAVKELNLYYKGKQIIKDLKLGDWVSFHWGYLCDVLTEQRVKNLEFYTKKAIEFYNSFQPIIPIGNF